MNLNFVKHFIKNQENLSNATSAKEIERYANKYYRIVLTKNFKDLANVLQEINPSQKSSVFLNNFEIWAKEMAKNKVTQTTFFSSNSDLCSWIDKYFTIFQKFGGLEIYIETEKNDLLLIHYQGDIIYIKKL